MSCCTEDNLTRMTMSLYTNTNLIGSNKKKCEKKCDKCEEKENEKKSIDLRKVVLLPLFMLFSVVSAWAQNAPKSISEDPFSHPMSLFYVIVALGIVTLILVVIVTVLALRLVKLFAQEAEKERSKRLGVVYKPTPSWWEDMWQSANAMIPLEQEKSIELDHNFDGIRELDNHLPPWWKGLFIVTIIWGVIYLGVFHVFNSLPLAQGEYENELAEAAEQARIFRASQPAAVIDENALTFTKDEAIIAKGKAIFESNCIACHRNDGGGNAICPNLTDAFWLHGGAIKNVFTTIKNGVVEKGMPAWGKSMSPQDVRDVAFFVLSLQGSNPKDAKAPQGVEFKAEEPKAPADSTKTQAMAKP